MKYIKYPFIIKSNAVNGEVDIEAWAQIPYSSDNWEIANRRCCDSNRVEIFDDGVPAMATPLDRIEAQTMYTAMVTGTLMEVESNV